MKICQNEKLAKLLVNYLLYELFDKMKKIAIMISILLFFNGLIIISDNVLSKENHEKILYVGGNGEGNFSKIQNAINYTTDGCIIFVYKGNYYENISINKSIELIGENNKYTIIHGESNIFNIKANNISISGFTLKYLSKFNDSGKKLISIEIVDFNKCIIKNNIVTDGLYGIYFSNSSSNIIENNTITNNTYGIFLSNKTKENILFHNNFLNNSMNSYDEGNNTWFDISLNQGNYWDDYEGIDDNNDGIGDTLYNIPGGKNTDKYPLITPFYGKIRLKPFSVDYDSLYQMLILGLVVSILFCLPIAYIWYKKHYKK